MRRKLAVAGASGFGYPTLLFLLGAAITFRVVPVFAESSSTPPVFCAEAKPLCVGKQKHEACGDAAAEYFCNDHFCMLDAGEGGQIPSPSSEDGRVCEYIGVTCKHFEYADCVGKQAHEACDPHAGPAGSKTCQPTPCLTLDGGFYGEVVPLRCLPVYWDTTDAASPLDASSTPPPRESAAPPSNAAPEAPSDDGGCAESRNVSSGILAFPVMVGLAWLLRRRRKHAAR